jgi:hypothetical protein
MKMNREEVWREIAVLPPEAQQEVLDFVQFLRKRHEQTRAKGQRLKTQLAEEAFVGIWRDRQDTEESSDRVRGVRRREWGS